MRNPPRARTDASLGEERAAADAALDRGPHPRSRPPAGRLTVERAATDVDLVGERYGVDTVLSDQREANAAMVAATLRAQEMTEAAEEALARAEAVERDLRSVAVFRETFMGMLGHDLRTPLGSILVASTLLLRRGKLDEMDAEVAARIVRSSQRMNRMITQLLDLTSARLGGGLPIERQAMDLRDVCRNAVDELEVEALLEVDGDVTGVWDGDRLAQLLSNLLGNAVEYGARGTPVLVRATASGEQAVIEVVNQGEPIAPALVATLFEPFRRAGPRRPSAGGNLGLGLYIAHEVVRAHGGTLDARSSEGTTTFTVRLPRTPSRAPA